ncbi:MAG: hypothetical protein INF91_00735 [Alphaproteobacteria bacterium]|nr:hypothetical protein [Alphaproteobacteria bacterium]
MRRPRVGPASAQTPPAAPEPAPAPAAAPANVASNVNINPKRVTFDALGKTAAVYIFNQGNGPGTFNIELIDRLMLPNGQIIPFDEAQTKPELKPLVDAMKSAKAMLLTTPRRATLQPGSGQTIRIRAGGAAVPPPGEYRSHLTVTALPPPDTGVTAEQAANQTEGALSFRVTSILGLSIPVIIRVGPIDVRAALEKPSLSFEDISPDGVAPPKRTPVLSLDLVRLGANSLFGDIEVRGAKETGNKPPLGAVRGIGVYTEIDRRQVKIALQRTPAPGEQIEILFRDDDTKPGTVLGRVTLKAS